MSTLTIHPENIDQETAIRLFLDALHVKYQASEQSMDDTAYFLASPVMTERLNIAAEQEKNGAGKTITLDEIWK